MQRRPHYKKNIRRRKKCLCCRELFEPDPRSKGNQAYCSKKECQKKRQRKNEKDWRKRNPECVEEQYKNTRLWNKEHSDYSRKRRTEKPKLLEANKVKTRLRMQKMRTKRMFDKSKSILLQLAGNKGDKCYLAQGCKWVFIRLTKASLFTKKGLLRDNQAKVKRIPNRLPKGRLYDLSEKIFNQSRTGP